MSVHCTVLSPSYGRILTRSIPTSARLKRFFGRLKELLTHHPHHLPRRQPTLADALFVPLSPPTPPNILAQAPRRRPSIQTLNPFVSLTSEKSALLTYLAQLSSKLSLLSSDLAAFERYFFSVSAGLGRVEGRLRGDVCAELERGAGGSTCADDGSGSDNAWETMLAWLHDFVSSTPVDRWDVAVRREQRVFKMEMAKGFAALRERVGVVEREVRGAEVKLDGMVTRGVVGEGSVVAGEIGSLRRPFGRFKREGAREERRLRGMVEGCREGVEGVRRGVELLWGRWVGAGEG